MFAFRLPITDYNQPMKIFSILLNREPFNAPYLLYTEPRVLPIKLFSIVPINDINDIYLFVLDVAHYSMYWYV